MVTTRDTPAQLDLYSLRERIDEHRSHAPSLCTARLARVSSKSRTLCRLGERDTKRPQVARLVL